MNVTEHTFRFTNEDDGFEVPLRIYVLNGATSALDTDTYLTAISDLEEMRDEWTAENEVDALVSEMVATAHTAIHDPGGACPPDGWRMVHA